MRNIKRLTISLMLVILVLPSFSQKTASWESPAEIYNSALELFHKQKYGAAQKQFLQVVDLIEAPSSLMEANAEYYAALCALELFNEDAEEMLEAFIAEHPAHSKVRTAYFQLGKFQYHKKRYRQAIRSFETVDPYDLNAEEKSEYNFKLGYSYFMADKYEEAKTHFYKIIEVDNKYRDPANYYYGHIAYTSRNYETALNSFNKLLENEMFKPILPYYITQIYYMQERYGKLLEVAPGLLENATEKRKPEISKLIGDAYYQKGNYSEAIPYLERYYNSAGRSSTRDDNYQLAFAYYRTGNCTKAIDHFAKVTKEKDTMAQNAYYHMAHCYIEKDEKKFAYNSFLSAYKVDAVEEVTRDALFNYAKLAYEMSYDPYNEAINAFQKFLDEYPESEHVDEVNSYLVKLFLSTKNFKNALDALDKIRNKSTKLRVAYQQIAYYRGVELFNNGHLEEAAKLFRKSLEYNYKKELFAKAVYWTAEAEYRQGKYSQAISEYKKFQLTAGSFRLPYYNESNYNIGYAYFKTKQYANALTSFRKFIDNAEDSDEVMVSDALIRTADCYYTQKRYAEAVETYEKAANMGVRDVDYALFQEAIAQGIMGKYETKTSTLKRLIDRMPESPYADDAAYEMADTYLFLEENQQALYYLNVVIDNYPNSSRLIQAMQKKALVYYNTDNYDLALNTFKKLRSEYPGTKESKEALVSIRNIYTNINKPEEFFKYARDNAITLTNAEQDSTMFLAAERIYMEEDCEKTIPSLRKYLKQYPKGIFALKAHYYLADCFYRRGNIEEARPHFKLIADTSMTPYKEKAVLKMARINYENENYNAALNYYQELARISDFKNNILEARKWIMRSYFNLNQHKEAIAAARSLRNTDKVSDEWISEAHMTIGQSAMELDSTATAKKAFRHLSKNLQNEMSVEAKYMLAEIAYNEGDLKESESILFEIINQVPSYDYWIGKSFILIAEIYYQRGNEVQAKATLQSIIDNYKVDTESNRPNLVEAAREKLNAIRSKEEAEQKKQEPEEMKLDYSGEEESDIFDEEQPDTLNQTVPVTPENPNE